MEGRVQGANGGQRGLVYKQPGTEVDDSCHNWRVPSVPDSKSRNIPEVVVARRRAGGVLGTWEGWVNWGRVGQTGSVYKQPEREVDDSYHNWRGQVSRGGCKGNTKGCKGTTARGRKANRNAPCIYVIVCMCNGMIER